MPKEEPVKKSRQNVRHDLRAELGEMRNEVAAVTLRNKLLEQELERKKARLSDVEEKLSKITSELKKYMDNVLTPDAIDAALDAAVERYKVTMDGDN